MAWGGSILDGLATLQSGVGAQVGVALGELVALLGIKDTPCGHQRLQAAHLLQALANVCAQLTSRLLRSLILMCLERSA